MHCISEIIGNFQACQFLLDFGDVSINEPDPVTQDTGN